MGDSIQNGAPPSNTPTMPSCPSPILVSPSTYPLALPLFFLHPSTLLFTCSTKEENAPCMLSGSLLLSQTHIHTQTQTHTHTHHFAAANRVCSPHFFMQFCDRYEIVEKPYSIIIASTTIFAVIDFALKQISCKVAPADAQMNQVEFGHLGFGVQGFDVGDLDI